MSYRRKFTPPAETREYRKLYVIAVEGDRTETRYFRFFGNEIDSAIADVEVIPPESKSAPQRVFENLQGYFDHPGVEGTVELWMVIDRDQWPREVLDEIAEKCREKNVGLCVSNPAFPFWLLLHFEKGQGIEPAEKDSGNVSAKECETRLRNKRYLPGFSKNLTADHWKLLREKLENAVHNAKELDSPPCKDYPRQRTGSTVYQLVEKLTPALSKRTTDQS